MTGANIDRCRGSQKTVTIEFTTLTLCRVRNFIRIEAFAAFRAKLWRKGWQVPTLTRVKNYKKLLPLLNSPPSICAEYEIASKLMHLPFFVQNYGLKDDRCQHWQVSIITENYCHQWIQHLQIVHYAKFRGKWLTSFPVPLFKDSRCIYWYEISLKSRKEITLWTLLVFPKVVIEHDENKINELSQCLTEKWDHVMPLYDSLIIFHLL